MEVRDTAIEAWERGKANGYFAASRRRVGQIVADAYPLALTQNEIHAALVDEARQRGEQGPHDWGRGTSTRLKELVRQGALIESLSPRPCRITGNRCITYALSGREAVPYKAPETENQRLKRENAELKARVQELEGELRRMTDGDQLRIRFPWEN